MLGQRVLFVCTPSLKSSTHAARVRASLGSRLVAEFTDVAPHVPRESVEAARALAAEKQVDVAVAMGGGSAIGVGKGVALGPHPDASNARLALQRGSRGPAGPDPPPRGGGGILPEGGKSGR